MSKLGKYTQYNQIFRASYFSTIVSFKCILKFARSVEIDIISWNRSDFTI